MKVIKELYAPSRDYEEKFSGLALVNMFNTKLISVIPVKSLQALNHQHLFFQLKSLKDPGSSLDVTCVDPSPLVNTILYV